MADLPPRTPDAGPAVTRRFFAVYWSTRIAGLVGFVLFWLGAWAGAEVGARMLGGRTLLGALIGIAVAGVVFYLLSLRHGRGLDRSDRDAALAREADREAKVQRKLAEAKGSGAFDRFGPGNEAGSTA